MRRLFVRLHKPLERTKRRYHIQQKKKSRVKLQQKSLILTGLIKGSFKRHFKTFSLWKSENHAALQTIAPTQACAPYIFLTKLSFDATVCESSALKSSFKILGWFASTSTLSIDISTCSLVFAAVHECGLFKKLVDWRWSRQGVYHFSHFFNFSCFCRGLFSFYIATDCICCWFVYFGRHNWFRSRFFGRYSWRFCALFCGDHNFWFGSRFSGWYNWCFCAIFSGGHNFWFNSRFSSDATVCKSSALKSSFKILGWFASTSTLSIDISTCSLVFAAVHECGLFKKLVNGLWSWCCRDNLWVSPAAAMIGRTTTSWKAKKNIRTWVILRHYCLELRN